MVTQTNYFSFRIPTETNSGKYNDQLKEVQHGKKKRKAQKLVETYECYARNRTLSCKFCY